MSLNLPLGGIIFWCPPAVRPDGSILFAATAPAPAAALLRNFLLVKCEKAPIATPC